MEDLSDLNWALLSPFKAVQLLIAPRFDNGVHIWERRETILWVGIVLFLLILSTSYFLAEKNDMSGLPLFTDGESDAQKRKEFYMTRSRKFLQSGYDKFKHQYFRIDTTDGPKVIVPRDALESLKSHPALSFKQSLDSDLLVEYTRLGGTPDIGITALTKSINPKLSAWTPLVYATIKKGLDEHFPRCKEWTDVFVYDKLLRIIASSSARIFLGFQASENEEWIDITTGYVLSAVSYAHALKKYSPFWRPFVYWRMPELQTIDAQFKLAQKIIEGAVKEGKDAQTNEPPTLLDILCEKVAPKGKGLNLHTLIQMTIAVAAIHTTSSTTTQALYDLAARPEYVKELREEIVENRKKYGDVPSKASLADLPKLDSFMKESQRLNSPDLTTFQRIAKSPFSLPNGVKVPAGTKLELATSAIQVDPSVAGDDPTHFNGYRFYKARQQPDSSHKHTYISVSRNDLPWGFGRHACPGRFLADIEVKIILSEILLHYDIKNPEGAPRHLNMEFENQVFPDSSKAILLKEVQG